MNIYIIYIHIYMYTYIYVFLTFFTLNLGASIFVPNSGYRYEI